MNLTIGQTIDALHQILSDYIEATYHISNYSLIKQRRDLLLSAGVIHQRPYLETTPRYVTKEKLANIAGLHPAAYKILAQLSKEKDGTPRIVYDPPYQHQTEAIKGSLVNKKSLVVMTGTGSGKTECFLLPILGKLAIEAQSNPQSFHQHSALRAIILYPMNALVNDQLGRLRLLFGDKRTTGIFKEWAGRPARFSRYTSRTLYPGVRMAEKDQSRLKVIGDYYVKTFEVANGTVDGDQESAQKLYAKLLEKGKWPAKVNLASWYGKSGQRWKDKAGNYQRCVLNNDDSELLTRHEVQASPPDVLVTNYSMLEYMLMRPIERPIFEKTKEWLDENPDQTLLLVVDEAHLYRGAGGAEVAYLIRRLRTRLGIPPERLQVICTSASFQDPTTAPHFAATLTGKTIQDFETIRGQLDLHNGASKGNSSDANILANIDLEKFYEAENDVDQISVIRPFLEFRKVGKDGELHALLYEALSDYPPMKQMINLTMQAACPVDSFNEEIFEDTDRDVGQKAISSLIALGSAARKSQSQPGLLPCRVHAFFRGLSGLWVCMNSNCPGVIEEINKPCGKLYSQPRDNCDHCGARVLELYTCRGCGTAYGRAYTDNLENPTFLWSEPGLPFRTALGEVKEIQALDLLLEEPNPKAEVEPFDYDLVTGRLNPQKLGAETRRVFLRKSRVNRIKDEDSGEVIEDQNPGEFRPCAVCLGTAKLWKTYVQDHQTKGDQPFQALVARQLQVQPPNPVPASQFAPLRGRKVLVFSDSRQTAARLAPNLQLYTTLDVLRPLILRGFVTLQQKNSIKNLLSLEDIFFAVLIAASELDIRLRPNLKVGETFRIANDVDIFVKKYSLGNESGLLQLLVDARTEIPPESIMQMIYRTLLDVHTGIESLALGSIVEKNDLSEKLNKDLPPLDSIKSLEQKQALVRTWLRCWRRSGFWLGKTPREWWQNQISGHLSGKFREFDRFLQNKNTKALFEKTWLPSLLEWFTEKVQTKYRLLGSKLSLEVGGRWAYCKSCRTTQRLSIFGTICVSCGDNAASEIFPEIDPVFGARKGYYRISTIEALSTPPVAPVALIAAEHTAQLNAAQSEDVFSKAEENELLFQDVDLGSLNGTTDRTAIDVLSCTTTMEVGIDIGTLSGVALRNMPPARSNYQQRAGRAGRRGNTLASVIAFGSADSHDEHYFTNPEQMIRGPVSDPFLNLNNIEIAQRHIIAYLLQRYHTLRLPQIRPEEQPQLFAVLGKVRDFKDPKSILNFLDFSHWITQSEPELRKELEGWLPVELLEAEFLSNFVPATVNSIRIALDDPDDVVESKGNGKINTDGDLSELTELPSEEGDETPVQKQRENLLDRLLYKGVLPRYAFPTDVASFYVFDSERFNRYQPAFRYSPSQGLSVALSEYAPGKEIWIGGKLYRSGAIYSPITKERDVAWEKRRLYLECQFCHYALTVDVSNAELGERRNCPACGQQTSLGGAQWWFRPCGFAHPVFWDEVTGAEDLLPRSYATRAKLTAPVSSDNWEAVNERLHVYHMRQHLLVSNRGPKEQGYSYCLTCGFIEPTISTQQSGHKKPYPDRTAPNCFNNKIVNGVVLGTDFITDVLLINIKVDPPMRLKPEFLSTQVVLRTISEALVKAACLELQLEASELQAEYRPALTEAGQKGLEAEIYLYDTLPGGAGFSRQAKNLGIKLFERAQLILSRCPDNCDSSCYRCLRSYKNKFDHTYLDRHLGFCVLNYLLTGLLPEMSSQRIQRSRRILYEDLLRQGIENISFQWQQKFSIPGFGEVEAPILASTGDKVYIIDVSYPLAPGLPCSSTIRDIQEFSPIPIFPQDELVVRKNIPFITSKILQKLQRS